MTDDDQIDREEELGTVIADGAALRPDTAAVGPNVLPIVRLRMMSHDAWEDFVLEWAHYLQGQYARVRRSSGAGDMGRDIIAHTSAIDNDPWDNYQCKHYAGPLAPSDVWLELGKFSWYTFRGAFSLPRQYSFVSPWGAGPSLSNLLDKPEELRSELLRNWDGYCRTGIRATAVDLTDDLRAHINSLDFSIFRSISPLSIIDEHRATPFYVARFGGGLPERPAPPEPPATAADTESVYIRALLDAYEEHNAATYVTPDDVKETAVADHFKRSRREFYSAEALREFARDNVPAGTFDQLVTEVHEGVIDVAQMSHVDGFERVLRVVAQAKALNLTSNALILVTRSGDRGGMCHQLANEGRLRWRR